MPLGAFKVGSLPTLEYVPEFITPGFEACLLREISSSKAKWKTVSGRRLQVHGGTVHKNSLLPAPMPWWLDDLVQRISTYTRVFGDRAANHVLVNSYLPGEGIMPHEDGPLYHPAVCILSLGSPAVLRFWRKEDPTRGEGRQPGASRQPAASVVCQPRSLLIFRDEAYDGCLHGIDFTSEDLVDASCVNAEQCGVEPGDVVRRIGERTSLTVRRVLRTCSLRLQL